MSKTTIPGIFWVILIVILVPMLIPVIQRVAPESTYWWSAIVVVILAAIAKTVEIVYKKQIEKQMIQPAATIDLDQQPAVAMQIQRRGPVASFLFG